MELRGITKEISNVIGRDATLFLIGKLPRYTPPSRKAERVVLYVPKRTYLGQDHFLVKTLGWDKAAALCEAFGGETLDPGNCAYIYRGYRDQCIRRLSGKGIADADLAEWFGVTRRHVRNITREIMHGALHAPANDNRAVFKKSAAA